MGSSARVKEMVLEAAGENPHIHPEVEGMEKPALAKALALDSLTAAMGPQIDMPKFDPSVTVTDIQLKKVKVMVKV